MLQWGTPRLEKDHFVWGRFPKPGYLAEHVNVAYCQFLPRRGLARRHCPEAPQLTPIGGHRGDAGLVNAVEEAEGDPTVQASILSL